MNPIQMADRLLAMMERAIELDAREAEARSKAERTRAAYLDARRRGVSDAVLAIYAAALQRALDAYRAAATAGRIAP